MLLLHDAPETPRFWLSSLLHLDHETGTPSLVQEADLKGLQASQIQSCASLRLNMSRKDRATGTTPRQRLLGCADVVCSVWVEFARSARSLV